MKKNYILLAMAFIGLNVSAQLTTIYQTDFSTLNEGQNILVEQDGEDLIWTGVNQIWQNFLKRDGGLQTQSNWRGAHLSGKPIGSWVVGKSVQVTTEIVITDASIFSEEVILNANVVSRDLMFGITERKDHDANDPNDPNYNGNDRGDAPSYGGAVSVGFEIRDLAATNGEMLIQLANATGQSYIIPDVANDDVVKFEYTVTKLSVADNFSAKLIITRNGSVVSTLESNFMQAGIYSAASENTVFNAYCKIPYNKGGISNGTAEDHGLLWASIKLEKENGSTDIATGKTLTAKVYYSRGVLYFTKINEEVLSYDIYDIKGSLVKEGTLPSTNVQVPLSLKKGIYLVRVGNSTTKIIL